MESAAKRCKTENICVPAAPVTSEKPNAASEDASCAEDIKVDCAVGKASEDALCAEDIKVDCAEGKASEDASCAEDIKVDCAEGKASEDALCTEDIKVDCAEGKTSEDALCAEDIKGDCAEFLSFDDATNLGVTTTAPFFVREKPWAIVQGDTDGWWWHESQSWLYNEPSDTYFHLLSKQLFRRPDKSSEIVVLNDVAKTTPVERERLEGVVQWWRREKGFGFVVAKGSTERIFCHQKQIEDEVLRFKGFRASDPVTFELAVIHDKICASAVRAGNFKQPIREDGEKCTQDGEEEVDAEEEEEESESDVEMNLVDELACSYATSTGADRIKNEDQYIEKIKLPILSGDADMVLLAIMDGHGSSSCSEYVQRHWPKNICTAMGSVRKNMKTSSKKIPFALQKSIEIVEHNFLQYAKKESDNSGTTVVGVVFYGPDEDGLLRMYTAHLGDSRAVLCRNGEAIRLTEDHKPDHADELKQLHSRGGRITYAPENGAAYVTVESEDYLLRLAMTRSVGDLPFKCPAQHVSSTAEVNEYTVDMDADEFVILSSDGILDYVTDAQLVDVVRRGFTAESIINLVRKLGCTDDCTLTIIRFGWRKDISPVPKIVVQRDEKTLHEEMPWRNELGLLEEKFKAKSEADEWFERLSLF